MDLIAIGVQTSVQDNCVIHTAYGWPVKVGDNVTIGHGAVIHGATIGDNCIIGMNATVLDGAKIGTGCIIGAGAVVAERTEIPPNSLAVGVPARVKNQSEKYLSGIMLSAEAYHDLAKRHKRGEFKHYHR